MSLSITRQDAERLLRQAQSARVAIKRAKETANEAVEQIVQTVEVSSTAFGFGLINGRWNGVEVLGVPLDALTALGLHALAFFGVAPQHLHNFGDGALASYLTTTGAGIGRAMAVRAASAAPGGALRLPSGASSGGAPWQTISAGGGGRLSDQQLADLARLA